MSTKDIVNQFNLRDYKRVGKASFRGHIFRLFEHKKNPDDEERLLIVESPSGELEKLDSNDMLEYGEDGVEDYAQLFVKDLAPNASFEDIVATMKKTLTSSEHFINFIKRGLMDVYSRGAAGGVTGLADTIKGLVAYFNQDGDWEVSRCPEMTYHVQRSCTGPWVPPAPTGREIVEAYFVSNYDSEAMGNACFSCHLSYTEGAVDTTISLTFATD